MSEGRRPRLVCLECGAVTHEPLHIPEVSTKPPSFGDIVGLSGSDV